jgi:hypothetical protein
VFGTSTSTVVSVKDIDYSGCRGFGSKKFWANGSDSEVVALRIFFMTTRQKNGEYYGIDFKTLEKSDCLGGRDSSPHTRGSWG